MNSSRRALLTLSSSVVTRSSAWLVAIETKRSIRSNVFIEFKAVSLQTYIFETAVLNSRQLKFWASTSYEWNSRTRTVVNAFLTRAFRSWFELIDFVKSHRCNKSRWIYRSNSILTLFNANLFIINRIEHIESKESVDSIIYSKNRVFDAFVRVFRDENMTSRKTHSEQWTHTDSILSKIEDRNINKKIASHEYDESWIQRIYSLLNEHAIELMSSQWVTNMQWARSRTRNHLITLSTFCRKMTNNIESLFEQIFEKQLYRIWSRVRKSYDCTHNESRIYKSSYDCVCNEFRIYKSYECRMQ